MTSFLLTSEEIVRSECVKPDLYQGSSQYILKNMTEWVKIQWERNGRCRHVLRSMREPHDQACIGRVYQNVKHV